MAKPAKAEEPATYEDVLAAPDNLVAELIHGILYTQPRPAVPHSQAATVLGEELGPPFRRGKGGPGGWIFLDGPELHLGPNVLVPDLAGWRRDSMPVLPADAYLTVRPDWLAEVLSQGTRRGDRALKLPLYAEAGTSHVWLIDPDARTLEVFRLDGSTYRLVVTFAGDEPVHAEPFDAIALELGALWQR